MKKKLVFGLLAILSVCLTVGIATAIAGGNDHVAPNDPDRPDCNCPAIYDPVVCKFGDEEMKFPSACVAYCNGATVCESAPDSIGG